MDKITIDEAQKLAAPGPVSIICTEMPDGKTNLAPVGWWTILSYHPGIIGFAMAKTSYSGEMMRRTGNAVISIPGDVLKDIVMPCGTTSGRETDKAKQFGIELQAVSGSAIKIPMHTRIAVIAKLSQTVEVGDHYLYICTVEQSYADVDEKPLAM